MLRFTVFCKWASLCILYCAHVSAFVGSFSSQRICRESSKISSRWKSPCSSIISSCLHQSLSDILEQLDEKGIRYPPSSSREDLEHLLKSEGSKPLTMLLAQLDIRNIKYNPNASRTELEQLLASHTTTTTTTNEDMAPETSNSREGEVSLPLNQLLEELDRRNIRYPPGATRKELEHLLKTNGNDKRPTTRRRAESRDASHDTKQDMPSETSASQEEVALPLSELLEELDRLNIRYPPSATREELEHLLNSTSGDVAKRPPTGQKAESSRVRVRPPAEMRQRSSVREDIVKMKTDSAKRLQRRKIRRQSQPSTLNQVLSQSSVILTHTARSIPRKAAAVSSNIRPGLSKFASRASNKVRQSRATRRATRPIDTPPENVPSAAKVSTRATSARNEPIDVEAVPVAQTQTKRPAQPPLRQSLVSAPSPMASSPQQPTRPRPPRPKPLRPRPQASADVSQKQRRPRKVPPPGAHRKIYNPYGTTSDNIDTRDAFDRFGDAIADAAESVIWGPDDEDDNEREEDTLRTPPESSTRRKRIRRHPTKSQAKYWKDRMEEQVDYLLGTHDDESTYTTWADFKKDPARRGNRSKFRSNAKEQNVKLPFWEEEGSLVSLLFGRRPSGGQLKLEEIFERKVGTNVVTNLISSVLKGSLLVASYLCRWASVKGAIPQPVVVMATVSAALSARRRRLITVVVTLLVLRTIGELVHGYIHGDKEWEDQELAPEGPAMEPDDSEESWDGDGL